MSSGNITPAMFRSAMIASCRATTPAAIEAMAEVEALMRARHLRLDQPNDFDLGTQDALLKVWDQFSQATFLALVVISSIALMVGGIGVAAIMMISVTERTREIGVRKALGARREILWQFLVEAAFLTSAGGLSRDRLRQLDRPPRALPVRRCRCRGGRSPSASASRRPSASSSASSPPSKPHGSIQSKRYATNRLSDRLCRVRDGVASSGVLPGLRLRGGIILPAVRSEH